MRMFPGRGPHDPPGIGPPATDRMSPPPPDPEESGTIMRHTATFLLLVLITCAVPGLVSSQPARGPAAAPEVIAVRMSNFAYDPDPLRLRAGVPVRLRFVNESGGGHDFAAPAFFAASAFAPGVVPPPDGKLEVAARSTAELTLTPRVPGTYEVRCTHFLHSLFGMTGTIVVTGPGG